MWIPAPPDRRPENASLPGAVSAQTGDISDVLLTVPGRPAIGTTYARHRCVRDNITQTMLGLDTIWGKPVEIKDIPLQRFDLEAEVGKEPK